MTRADDRDYAARARAATAATGRALLARLVRWRRHAYRHDPAAAWGKWSSWHVIDRGRTDAGDAVVTLCGHRLVSEEARPLTTEEADNLDHGKSCETCLRIERGRRA